MDSEIIQCAENFKNMFSEQVYNKLLSGANFKMDKETQEFSPYENFSRATHIGFEIKEINGTPTVHIWDLVSVTFPFEWLDMGYKRAKRRIVKKFMWDDIPTDF